MCSRGIRPGVGQRLEASAGLGDHVEDIEQVAGRPPTPHFHGSDKPRACCFILSRRERARTEPKGANGLLGRVRLGPEHNTAPYVNR